MELFDGNFFVKTELYGYPYSIFFIKKTTMRLTLLAGIAFLLFSGSSCKATVNVQKADHPYYLHALSDLRSARWMIEHRPGNWERTVDEIDAVKQIDAAIGEIKKAAIDDGKNIADHPAVDEPNEHNGRLHVSVDFLKKARQDISHDEDNAFAQGLQARAYNHIDAAISSVRKAIHA
jgi:hypothetical protein